MLVEIGTLYNYPYISYKEYQSEAVEFESSSATSLIWNPTNNLKCKINTQVIFVEPNSVILLGKGDSFCVHVNNLSEIKVIRFNSNVFLSSIPFMCGFINTVSKRGSKDILILPFKDAQTLCIENIFISIQQLLKEAHPINISKLKAVIIDLLNTALKDKFIDDAHFINCFGVLLNSKYNIHHNVCDYAKELRLKPKNLLRKFQKEGLKNPSEIIKEKLILEIKEKLVYTDKSIREICFEVGFYDPAYFSRFFKKHMSVTAQYFRKQYSCDLVLIEMEKSAIE